MRGVEQQPVLYDFFMGLVEAIGFKSWREWLARGARGRTLDLGCGTGRNLPLIPPESTVFAVDPILDNLKAARRRSSRALLVRASAEQLPFRDGTFDTVLAGYVFCSIPHTHLALSEIQRTLRPEGELRALEHVRSDQRWKAWVQDALAPAWKLVTGGCHLNRETEATVKAEGFAVDEGERRASGVIRRFRAKPLSA